MTRGRPDDEGRADNRLRISYGSVLLVVAAVLTAVTLANIFEAARRPISWAFAAAMVAWLLSAVIAVLDRWLPRKLAVPLTTLGFVVVAGGGWVGVRATLRTESRRLKDALPDAARELEARYEAVADFRLLERTEAFVDSLDERFATGAQVQAAAGTASAYIVSGVLMLFLVGYGPRYIRGALDQIRDDGRRAAVADLVYRTADTARGYLLAGLAQAFVLTLVCTSVFYLLDLPAPFVLALLVAWLGAIPYFGIVLGGIPALLAAAADPSPLSYAVLLTLLVGLQLTEALVVRPRVDGRTVHVGPAIVLAGFLVGFQMYGFGGALYGTAALIIAWTLLQKLPDRSAGERLTP